MVIYGLFDPRSNQLRYVGFTSNPLRRRLGEHLRDPSNTHKGKWIRSLLKDGYKPEIDVLQTTTDQERVFDEQWSIAYYRSIGCNLTNGTLGGDGVLGHVWTEEQKRQISKSKTNPPPETRKRMSDGNRSRPDRASHLALMIANAAKATMVKKRKLTDEQVAEAKILNESGVSFKLLGERYGVTGNAVWFNVRGKLKYQDLTQFIILYSSAYFGIYK